MKMHSMTTGLLLVSLAGCASVGGAAPTGSKEKLTDEDTKAMEAIGAKVKGTIVWSSSRVGNHDLYVMQTDGSGVKAITKGDFVDWFPRFSPDGSKILFTRSKKGWVSERDANDSEKWNLFTINADGSDLTKVVDKASWGSWIGPDEIVFVRGTKIFRTKVGSEEEVELMDSAGVSDLDGALLQQPEMSRDGKYIAITLRGSKRETGIWNIKKKTWTKTGLGCQINWTPDGSSIYWVNPTGNGGSEVRRLPIKNGKAQEVPEDEQKMMDLPGRRSHEYFPQLSVDGKWMVWGITQRGHDHDIADYEIYVWEVGSPAESAARLTFHSGNDRWPDIFIPDAAGKTTSTAEESSSEAKEEPAAAETAAAAEPAAEEPEEEEAAAPAAAASNKKAKGKPAKRRKKK